MQQPPVRRQGREFTEAVERLAAGGVVLIPVPQTKRRDGDKNNGTEPTRTSPPSQERDNMDPKTQAANGETKTHNNDGALSALERLAGAILGKVDKGESVAKVTTVRTLGEKTIDAGITAGAVFIGTTAAIAVGRYVFGIGKAPKAAPVIPMA